MEQVKSTLLKIILGLLPLQKGEIYIDGKSYKKQNQSALKISYVSQKATDFLIFGFRRY